MTQSNLEKRRIELVERIGVFLEKYGYQPIPARIIGLLMVTEKPYLTFDEITDNLKVSKSAVSIGLNLLLGTQQIDYITLPGDRKRYFKSRIGEWRQIFTGLIGFANSIRTLLLEVIELQSLSGREETRSLKEVVHLIDLLEKEVPRIVMEWDDKQRKEK
jgi:DNA-binding transcriptional regulator GbsR (MarR family)